MYFYKKIVKDLIKKNISVSIAESCTGGKLSSFFTAIPNVSKIFNLGVVTYSNQSKNKILNIPISLINKHGAVSKKISKKMSYNLYKITKSDLCISITGIAGPTGGSTKKPIGLVYICIRYKKKKNIFKMFFKGSRQKIQKEIVINVLKLIKKLI